MTAVLGVNCFSHDTSACLLVDGAVVAIGEQERFNRDAHTKAFPDAAIEFCLRQAGLSARDLTAVAFAHDPRIDFMRGAADAVARVAPKRLGAQAYTDVRLVSRERRFRRRWGYGGQIVHVGHHDAHAASAFFSSPFDQAAVLTLDRGGDFLSTTMQLGQGNRLRRLKEVRNPHSLGELYSAFTWLLGFRPNADEGKVMGLSSYGRDTYVEDFRDLVRLLDDGRFRVDLKWFGYQRERGWFSRSGDERFGPRRAPESDISARHEDLAHAIQHLVEDAGVHIARSIQRATGLRRLCLAGGVALNSVMNARILAEAGFDEIFIQPAASDAGNALGAAAHVWHQGLGERRAWHMAHPFWGPSYTDEEMARALEARGLSFRKVADPEREAAARIADGKVVGWFQGRAEIGPRALGARSILADPRHPEMKDIVNARVKRREAFRPFAPSVLDERGAEYFDHYSTNPFMLLVLPVRKDKRDVIPAVTHVDGTGRLQSVTREFNPAYHRLITEFERLTGVPVVLNTSFNLRGEPIVNSPDDAVADYLRSGMEALLLGRCLVEKE
ncbi:carbamoyltransferase family protein [Blastococcus deserti]|uniref:Carbamoyltransferase n=1 Tax=Blastococcus deserti TaxID=2259033 RepID=A0ABW4X885_9ACTN